MSLPSITAIPGVVEVINKNPERSLILVLLVPILLAVGVTLMYLLILAVVWL